MNTKVGSNLILISAIIFIVFAVLFFIGSILVYLEVMEQTDGQELSPEVAGTIILVVAMIMFCLSLVEFWTYKLTKSPETMKKGGVIALIIGIIGLFLGGVGILSIIGGVLVISQEKK